MPSGKEMFWSTVGYIIFIVMALIGIGVTLKFLWALTGVRIHVSF